MEGLLLVLVFGLWFTGIYRPIVDKLTKPSVHVYSPRVYHLSSTNNIHADYARGPVPLNSIQ